MSERVVTTQAELDAALAGSTDQRTIYIDSPAGVWLQLRGSAHVVARGSAHVVAWGSAHVEAWDSAHVEAWDSAHVVARGSAHVEAWDSAHVEASRYVAIHLHSARATVQGGVLIDLTAIDWTDPQQWCEYHGVTVDDDGRAVLYKALPDDLTTGRDYDYPVTWTPGTTVVAADWPATNDCGFGLHLSPHPSLAQAYRRNASRYMRVSVEVATMRPIPGGGAAKCKVQQAVVVAEVDRWCQPIAPAAAEEVLWP